MKQPLIATLIYCFALSAPVQAGTIYAAYHSVFGGDDGGIVEFESNTLAVVKVIPLTTAPHGIAYDSGHLFDSETDQIIERDPATGAIQSTPLFSGELGNNGNTVTSVSVGVHVVGVAGPLYLTNSLNAAPLSANLGPWTNVAADGAKYFLTESGRLDLVAQGMFGPNQITNGPDVSSALGTLGPLTLSNNNVFIAFSGIGGVPGVGAFDPATLNFTFGGFFTSVEPTGLVFADGSLFDSEFGVIYRRDPVTGAILAQSAPLGAAFGNLAFSPVPEPGALLLAGVGLAILMCHSRARRGAMNLVSRRR